MAGKTKTDATEALKQVTYLASALKAPRITEAAGGTSKADSTMPKPVPP